MRARTDGLISSDPAAVGLHHRDHPAGVAHARASRPCRRCGAPGAQDRAHPSKSAEVHSNIISRSPLKTRHGTLSFPSRTH